MNPMRTMLACLFVALGFLLACTAAETEKIRQIIDDNGGDSELLAATFGLTDAPSDELSVLQIEITGVSVFDASAVETEVFPAPNAPSTLVVNLLRLQGISKLLGAVGLAKGEYTEVRIDFENAKAVDVDGNELTVNPSTSGTIVAQLTSAANLNGTSAFFDLDFDVDNSVSDLVTGAGGSLTFDPTLLLVIDDEGETERKIDEVKGRVASLSALEFKMTVGRHGVLVTLSDSTVVEVEGQTSTPADAGFDLASLLAVDDIVEVSGSFDAAANAIAADKVELLESFERRSVLGLVASVDVGGFDMLILDAENSTRAVGGIITIDVDANTRYFYVNPESDAEFSSLAVGQEVRVVAPASVLVPESVRLRRTLLLATVDAVDSGAQTASVTVDRIDGVSVARLANFTNPITLQFDGEVPARVAVGASMRFGGHFNRLTAGAFDVIPTDDGVEEAPERTGAIEGEKYSLQVKSPLAFELTGEGDNLGIPDPATVTVTLVDGAEIVEKNANTDRSRRLTEAELAEGIEAGSYVRVVAVGRFDVATNILSAKGVKVLIRERDDTDVSIESTKFSVLSESPVVLSVTGFVGGSTLSGSIEVEVELSSSTVIAERDRAEDREGIIRAEDLVEGIRDGRYGYMKVRGTMDASSKVVSASGIFVRTAEEREARIESGQFSVLQFIVDTELTLEVTGEASWVEDDGMGTSKVVTVHVTLEDDAKIVLFNSRGNEELTPEELANGINGDEFRRLVAVGSYDEDTNTLTARSIAVRAK